MQGTVFSKYIVVLFVNKLKGTYPGILFIFCEINFKLAGFIPVSGVYFFYIFNNIFLPGGENYFIIQFNNPASFLCRKKEGRKKYASKYYNFFQLFVLFFLSHACLLEPPKPEGSFHLFYISRIVPVNQRTCSGKTTVKAHCGPEFFQLIVGCRQISN